MAAINPTPKLRLGELLVQAGVINEEQLKKALGAQKRTGKRLGEVLVQEGIVTQAQLGAVLENQLGIRQIDLRTAAIDSEAVRRIPENLARRHMVVPIQVADGHLMLAMKDPLDRVAIQDVRLISGLPVTPLLAGEREILRVIEQYFGQQRVAERAAQDLVRTATPATSEVAATLDVESAPMVRLVNSVIENAVRSRASDIHIEPKQDILRIRTRVDGILHETLTTDIRVHSALVTRIKVMANMNIAEKRVPQDGKVGVTIDNRQIDLRIASMPTTHGEKLVIRVLDRAAFFVGKQNLGFSVEDAAKFDRLVNRPWGLVLVTGPTGSGKTTTLYSMLAEMDANRLNISTLEDPVEYEMSKITQTQINVQAGLTFVSGLRNMLRQDPDVVMVGEIRDDETADIAIRAALTGHLVLSTLHTNDAPGAVTRLMDMGIEPYLIASSLAGVIAQRLVRKICPECQEVYAADKREHEILAIPPEEELFLKRGVGCPACHDTGYQGRTGVFEILELDRELRSLIDHRVPTDELHQAAINRGMVPLWEDCREKVLSGITTLEEALRVTQMY
jgi:type IV pilus assembly protein PilB